VIDSIFVPRLCRSGKASLTELVSSEEIASADTGINQEKLEF
jgi:hypothetical protein